MILDECECSILGTWPSCHATFCGDLAVAFHSSRPIAHPFPITPKEVGGQWTRDQRLRRITRITGWPATWLVRRSGIPWLLYWGIFAKTGPMWEHGLGRTPEYIYICIFICIYCIYICYIYIYIDMCVYLFTLFTYRKRRRKVICHYLSTSVLSICLWGIVYTCVWTCTTYVHIEICTVHMIDILDIPDIPTWVLTECDCMSVCMPTYFHTYDQRHMISPLIEG